MVRPASKNRSPSTLKSRPWDETAPIVAGFFLLLCTGRLVCRKGEEGVPGPIDELRFTDSVVGVFALRSELPVLSSGWLCWEGNGGRELRSGMSFSIGLGISETGGKVGNIVALRYSLPRGDSRDCTCHLCSMITTTSLW